MRPPRIVMTGYISIVRNADIFIKSYKSGTLESRKSAFLKHRHMADRTKIWRIEKSIPDGRILGCNQHIRRAGILAQSPAFKHFGITQKVCR